MTAPERWSGGGGGVQSVYRVRRSCASAGDVAHARRRFGRAIAELRRTHQLVPVEVRLVPIEPSSHTNASSEACVTDDVRRRGVCAPPPQPRPTAILKGAAGSPSCTSTAPPPRPPARQRPGDLAREWGFAEVLAPNASENGSALAHGRCGTCVHPRTRGLLRMLGLCWEFQCA